MCPSICHRPSCVGGTNQYLLYPTKFHESIDTVSLQGFDELGFVCGACQLPRSLRRKEKFLCNLEHIENIVRKSLTCRTYSFRTTHGDLAIETRSHKSFLSTISRLRLPEAVESLTVFERFLDFERPRAQSSRRSLPRQWTLLVFPQQSLKWEGKERRKALKTVEHLQGQVAEIPTLLMLLRRAPDL